MNHIIVNYRLFTTNQNVLVYSNGECIYQCEVPLNQVNNTVASLRKQYDVKRIDLCGNGDYLQKFKAEMLTQFGNNECEIFIKRR